MREYLEYLLFKKGESYKWEWNYVTFYSGWIRPQFGFLFCDFMEHLDSVISETKSL